MRIRPVLLSCFSISVLAVPAGSLLKIIHWMRADWLLGLGLLATLVFAVAAVYEIATSPQASGGQKVLGMAVVLLGGTLGALLYLLLGRQYVVERPQ